jgi:hypothetical protein
MGVRFIHLMKFHPWTWIVWGHVFSHQNSFCTSGYPWPSNTVRCKRNVPTLSLLELQRERRETTKLGYPGRCRWQTRKHTGSVPVHSWQRAWFMALRLGSSWGDQASSPTRFNIYSRGSTHLGAARLGPSFFLSFGSLKLGRWDLGLGLVETQDSGLDK